MEQYLMIRKEFEEHADEQTAASMSCYMRNQFLFYGIPTPKRRGLTREYLKEMRQNETIQWDFVNSCYEDEHREFQYVAIDYLQMMKKFLSFEDIPQIKACIETKSWWDTVDCLDGLLGDIHDYRLPALMIKWSQDQNLWVRRVAIDHQLNKKGNTDPELLEQIIVNNLESNEFFINKAIGWSLREYSKVNPQWVLAFLKHHQDHMSALSVREAKKYLR